MGGANVLLLLLLVVVAPLRHVPSAMQCSRPQHSTPPLWPAVRRFFMCVVKRPRLQRLEPIPSRFPCRSTVRVWGPHSFIRLLLRPAARGLWITT